MRRYKGTDTILRHALKLISEKKHWTQRANSRDTYGEPCDVLSDHATTWCARGAIMRLSIDHESQFRATEALYGALGSQVTLVNDGPRGYARIKAGFTKAIKAEKAK